MKITKNSVAALTYELNVEGKIADRAGEDRPLEYIHGTGMLLPKFESEVEGKEAGDSFAFTLTPEEGYGVFNPDYLIDLPKTCFQVEGKIMEELLVVGRTVPMLNNAGQVVQGTVYAIKDDMVTMDFNHPMAGKTLNFTGKVVSVREATEKELTEGLHGEYLPKEGCGHCGGHCSDGECGGDCNCSEEKKDCGGKKGCGCSKK